jgi:hypothetical protein
MTILKNTTPTPAQAAAAYKEVFAPVLQEAGGKDGRISRAGAAAIAARDDAGKLVADNVTDHLDRTGQKTVSARKLIGVLTAAVEADVAQAAGPNQRLSLVELRNLPANLKDDLLHLRGKDTLATPLSKVEFEEAAMYQFMFYASVPWKPTELIMSGRFDEVGGAAVIAGVTTQNPDWQAPVELALQAVWQSNFASRTFDGPFSIPADGHVRVGEVVDEKTGKAGLLVHWNDLDDASYAYFLSKKPQGDWDLVRTLFLN